jgi:ubiquinone/menaquinone biosynthesis C-methylase UbiE
MDAASPQFEQLKSALKATWMAGDFGEIAKFTANEAESFVGRVGIRPGLRVLDVACGTGNSAIPAARAGADVTGVDIAPNSLAQARKRAVAEKLSAKFEEGDAEALPFPDAAFDVVITMFGAMFAPRPDRVATELLRVCKPGGTIAMANWTPEGFVGKSFRATAELVPPPPGIPAPVLWGDEKVVRQRFASAVSKLSAERRAARFQYPFPPEQVVELFREYFGPTKMAFSRLDESGKKQLSTQMESLWRQHNLSHDGTTHVEAEYLEVKAVRA